MFSWEKTYYDKKTERTFVFEWNDSIHHRIRGRGCPYLSGKGVMVGFNDLATTNPEILIEWNSEKNNELQPISVTAGSHKQVWWKCARGHEWKASIKDKVHYHTSCPICSREIKTSFPEQALFYYINKHFKDAVNGDMHLGVELDIYIPSRRIAIEYDGYNWHKKDSQVRRDLKKNTVCANNDISLLRIREDGLRHLESCTEIFIERDVSDASLTRVIGSVLKLLGI